MATCRKKSDLTIERARKTVRREEPADFQADMEKQAHILARLRSHKATVVRQRAEGTWKPEPIVRYDPPRQARNWPEPCEFFDLRYPHDNR